MELDENTSELPNTNTRMKIDNTPLRSCYQRTSDSPQYDYNNDDSNVAVARKRRSTLNMAISKGAGNGKYHRRIKRAEIVYAFDTLCDNIFNGATSSLAT